MSKKLTLNMVGSTEEDKQMMDIIKHNQMKVREANARKLENAKMTKFENVMIGIGRFIIAGTSFIGIMYLIALVESLKF